MSNKSIHNDYGDYKVKRIIDGSEFWQLMDALVDDKSGFLHNRDVIVNAFRNSKLYGLVVDETEEMFERRAWHDPIFCPGSWYLLPCFCVVSGRTANIIWTHSRARNNGMAKTLINELDIQCAENPLPDSISFWHACGIYDFAVA